jgi:hypothetical protein
LLSHTQVCEAFAQKGISLLGFQNEAPGFQYNPHGMVSPAGSKHDLELEALAERHMLNAKVSHVQWRSLDKILGGGGGEVAKWHVFS